MERISKAVAACPSSEISVYLTAACRAAVTAGYMIKELYSKPHSIEMKGVINLVTEADVAAEAAIIASLGEDAPGIDIMAEESAGDTIKKPKGRTWIIDPLDGTTNFAHKFPVYTVSIALEKKGNVIIGVVYDPSRDEMFWATKEGGAFLNGERIEVSSTESLDKSIVATGFPYDVRESEVNNIDNFSNFV